MKDEVYIVVDANGALRMTKRFPSLYRHEIAVKVRLTVPDAAFRPSVLVASVDVQEGLVIQPTAEVEAISPDAQP